MAGTRTGTSSRCARQVITGCITAAGSPIEGRAPDEIRFDWKNRPQDNAHVGTHESQRARVGTNDSASRFNDAVMRAQARDALVGLGWKRGIARAAVDDACADVSPLNTLRP